MPPTPMDNSGDYKTGEYTFSQAGQQDQAGQQGALCHENSLVNIESVQELPKLDTIMENTDLKYDERSEKKMNVSKSISPNVYMTQ